MIKRKQSPGAFLALLVFAFLLKFVIGGFLLNYVLLSLIGKSAGFFIGGMVAALLPQVFTRIVFVLAVLCLLLHSLGVHLPVFHL